MATTMNDLYHEVVVRNRLEQLRKRQRDEALQAQEELLAGVARSAQRGEAHNSVGGTQSFSPEEAWMGSSGGFSNYYSRPLYQQGAVTSYLNAHGNSNKGRFNASGRAFPDIAAKADDFIIYADIFFPIVGTSASSPTVASIFALINDRLLSADRPVLGFLNPWLYKEGFKAFTDIASGASSIQCSSNATAHGFAAVEGWDPVTGLGTPRFDKLLDLLHL
ncbi:hypothetical protein ACG7TL_001591 [Trametes sanguinea]